MKIKIINIITGFLMGVLITVGIILSSEQKITSQKETVQNGISMVPKELPKNEIEFDVIEIPENLKEVNIL